MVDGIKTGVCSVDRVEERKQVHTAEQSRQGPAQQLLQSLEINRKAINIGDQLDLVLQHLSLKAETGARFPTKYS